MKIDCHHNNDNWYQYNVPLTHMNRMMVSNNSIHSIEIPNKSKQKHDQDPRQTLNM